MGWQSQQWLPARSRCHLQQQVTLKQSKQHSGAKFCRLLAAFKSMHVRYTTRCVIAVTQRHWIMCHMCCEDVLDDPTDMGTVATISQVSCDCVKLKISVKTGGPERFLAHFLPHICYLIKSYPQCMHVLFIMGVLSDRQTEELLCK